MTITSTRSRRRPVYPEISPSGTPITRAKAVEASTTWKASRAPKITRDSTSKRRLVVPKGCERLGRASWGAPSKAAWPWGARSGANSATTAKPAVTTAPPRSRFRLVRPAWRQRAAVRDRPSLESGFTSTGSGDRPRPRRRR